MPPRSKRRLPRSGLVAAGVGGLVVLVFGAIVFSNSQNAQASLREAEALHSADMALAVQDVAMKSIGQLVILAQDQALGVAGAEAVEASAIEAERALAEFDARITGFEGVTAVQIRPLVVDWRDTTSRIVDLALTEDPNVASAVLVGELVPTAEQIAEVVTAERGRRAEALNRAQGRFGSLATIAGFLTAFVLPLAAMLAYRQSMRRQLEVSEAHLDARLEAEESVGRAKDQFIANISHELRTPLTSIYGFSEVLLDQGFVDPAMATDLVSLINGESAELARMVEDLLVAAHDDDTPLTVEISPVDITEEMETVLVPFRRHGFEINGTWAGGTISGDPLRLRQILRNLVANAVKHGGPTVNVHGEVVGDRYVVTVEDDGAGVPEHLRYRLFSRFIHQGDAPLIAGSVGLGLAVAHRLSEQMGGSLEYEHTAGLTTFKLEMPLQPAATAVGAEDPAFEPATQ